ncbi:hypothetical protein [Nocardia tengchongensis]|uniref:hypothetical protein n=1 Tax=Nocardia tengchongensis TaxID=2055889 RepID=UPI0036BE8C81
MAISLDEQQPLDASIGYRVLAHLRADEESATLSVGVDEEGGISIQLISDARSIIMTDDDLEVAIVELVNAHERVNTGLSGARYSFSKKADGHWTMVGQFSYELSGK